jgi:hypothetical protein
METNKKNTEKVAWILAAVMSGILIVFSLLFGGLHKSKPRYEVHWKEGGIEKCDTFKEYEIVSFLIFDSCYKFKNSDKDYTLICDKNFTKKEIK